MIRWLRPVAASLLAWLGFACALSSGAPPEESATLPRSSGGAPSLVVLASVRGLVSGHYLGDAPAMPTLAKLADGGVAALSVSGVAPPSAYPVHATLVTGVVPALHGVPADRRLGQRGVRPARASHASALKVPALWSAVSEAGGRVASLDWPVTVGASIATLLPDVTVTRAGERWATLALQEATPDLGVQLGSPAALRAERPGPERDAFLVDVACGIVQMPTPPRLLQIRFQGPEPSLAAAGPQSPEAARAYGEVDREIARLLRCLERSARLSTTAIVVVGDAGMGPVHSELRVNAALAEAGLVERGRAGRISSWRALARSNGGSAFVYAADPPSAVEARRVLEAHAEATGAFRVVSADEMIAQGSDPEAWFGLEARPGFAFRDDARGEAVVPARRLAAAGYLDESSTTAAGLVAWGRGFRAGLRVPEMAHQDVAPTLARLLRVSLPDATGRSLVGLLAPGNVSASPPEPDDADPSDGAEEELP